MLGKLLKYDLKWIYKLISVFYLLALVFSLFSRIFNSIDNSLLFNIVGSICNGFAIAMMFSCLINTLMRSWVRFVRNVYKDESYLTHTLPVSKKDIFLSKVISAVIASFTTILVILICLFICYYSKANLDSLKNMLDVFAFTYDTTVIKFIIILFVVLFLELLFILLIGYIGIIMGHKSNDKKMLKSIVYGFLFYILSMIGIILIILVIGIFNKDIMNVINTTSVISLNSIKTLIYLCIGIYTLYNIICYVVGSKELESGVNIE